MCPSVCGCALLCCACDVISRPGSLFSKRERKKSPKTSNLQFSVSVSFLPRLAGNKPTCGLSIPSTFFCKMKPEIVSSAFLCCVVGCRSPIAGIYIMFLFFLFFLPLSQQRGRQRDYFLHICSGFSTLHRFTGTTSKSLMALDSKLTPGLPVAAPAGWALLTRLGPCSAAARVISKLWLIRLMEESGGGDKNQGNH